MREVAGRFVQVAIGPDCMLSVKVIQSATRFEEIATGFSATRKLGHPSADDSCLRSAFVPGEAHCLCFFEVQNPDVVRELNETAGIPFKRIVEAMDLTPK